MREERNHLRADEWDEVESESRERGNERETYEVPWFREWITHQVRIVDETRIQSTQSSKGQ